MSAVVAQPEEGHHLLYRDWFWVLQDGHFGLFSHSPHVFSYSSPKEHYIGLGEVEFFLFAFVSGNGQSSEDLFGGLEALVFGLSSDEDVIHVLDDHCSFREFCGLKILPNEAVEQGWRASISLGHPSVGEMFSLPSECKYVSGFFGQLDAEERVGQVNGGKPLVLWSYVEERHLGVWYFFYRPQGPVVGLTEVMGHPPGLPICFLDWEYGSVPGGWAHRGRGSLWSMVSTLWSISVGGVVGAMILCLVTCCPHSHCGSSEGTYSEYPPSFLVMDMFFFWWRPIHSPRLL